MLNLMAIGLTYMEFTNPSLLHMFVVGTLIVLAGEFNFKAVQMGMFITSIDRRRSILAFRGLFFAYCWHVVFVIGLFFLPEYLSLEMGEYKVLSLGWGLKVDMGLFTLLLDVYVILALSLLLVYVHKMEKRIIA